MPASISVCATMYSTKKCDEIISRNKLQPRFVSIKKNIWFVLFQTLSKIHKFHCLSRSRRPSLLEKRVIPFLCLHSRSPKNAFPWFALPIQLTNGQTILYLMAGSNGDRSLERLSRFRLSFFPRSFLEIKIVHFQSCRSLKELQLRSTIGKTREMW